MNIRSHYPTDDCWAMHCDSHNVDEASKNVYIRCGECGHLYPTKRALRKAWRDRGREIGWTFDWRFRAWFKRASKIYFCPECSHDF